MELTVVNATVVGFWVKIKGQTNNADVIMGVCHRPPSQEGDADELIFEEPRDTSKSTAFVLMGDFSLRGINWEHHRAGTNGSRRFIEHLDDHFMIQVLRELARKDALLDLLLANREGFVSKVEVGRHLHHSDCKAIKFN